MRLVGRTEEVLVADDRPPKGLLGIHLDQDAEVPEIVQLGPEKEDAVDEEHTVGGRDRRRVAYWYVGEPVEDTSAIAAPAARPQRHEQLAAVEVVDSRPEDGTAARHQERLELVGEGRLPAASIPSMATPAVWCSCTPATRSASRSRTAARLGLTPTILATLRRPRGSTRVAKGDGL